MTSTTSGAGPGAETKLAPVSFLGRFMVLKGATRELWLVFLVKLLGIVAYSIMNTTFVLWLSYDLGYTDQRAGFLVATWSTVMTLITVFVGSLTDAIGLRKALLLGLCVCVLSRLVMTVTTVKWLALAGGMLPLALGEALGVPVLVAGVRRYSTTSQRSISFAIFYAMMNVGFLIASLVFDYVRRGLGEPHGHLTLPLIGMELTTYRTLFLLSFLFEFSLLPIVYFGLRGGVEATDEGVKITPEQSKYPGVNLWRALVLVVRDASKETVRIFVGLWQQPGFYKFLAFLTLAAFVRLIFIHMYYTYPKFGIRELGEGAPVGRLFAVNSVLIIFLAPLVGALTQKISAYRMVSFGSAIAAASVFIMALPPHMFQPLADGRFGHGLVNQWFGGYSRFTPDDFRNLPPLAAKLQSGTDTAASALNESLSEKTRVLLRRQLEDGSSARGAGPRPSTALLAPGDIRGLEAFVAKLQEDSEAATRPVSRAIWERFSAESQRILQDASPPEARRQAVLVQELNRILHSNRLYDAQRFAGVPLSEAARALVAKDPKRREGDLPNQSLLLNRLLLEDTYPQAIPRSAHPLGVALAEDLTKLIQGPALAERRGFAEVTLSAETKERMASRPKGQSSARLNRMVLEDAFPSEIAPNRLGVVGGVSPYYVMIFLFITVLSVGEAFYSPRLYEYAAVIAPKGQEASYMSLSYLPFFMAKLLVATFSGVLLANYCPETGPRQSATMWLIIALTTTIAPAGLMALRRFIRVKEAGRED
jgi:MFS family permease